MSNDNRSLVRDVTCRETINKFARVENEHGKVIVGLAIEGMLDGCVVYLNGSVGAEAAYNILQRYADEIAGGLAEIAARHQ